MSSQNIYIISEEQEKEIMKNWVMPDDFYDMSNCEPCVVPRVEYTRGKDHHNYGKTLSKEHRQKIALSKLGRKLPQCGNPGKKNGMYNNGHVFHQKVKVGDKTFESCQSAAKYLGITKSTFSYWIKTGKAVKI